MTTEERDALVAELEAKIRPLIEIDKGGGGFDCCGCSTYHGILDAAIAIVRGQRFTIQWPGQVVIQA